MKKDSVWLEIWWNMEMKLYKYKSLKNFEHVADIICNKRFYAAQYYELNDPMEGLYNCEPGTKREYLDAIKEGKKKLRICSFSKDSQNPLLWAHYADGFKGICIEVEINEDPSDFDIAEVEYSPIRILFSNKAVRLIDELPKLILRQKAEEWSVEQEVRLLTNDKFISYGIKITGLLLGVSISDVLKQSIKKLAAPNIPIWETRVGETNKIEIGPDINQANQIKQ